MVHPPRRTRAIAGVVGSGLVALIVLGLVAFRQVHLRVPGPVTTPGRPQTSACVVAAATGRLHLDPAQAENATTIAAVAKRDGLADHAVTVALVAALQESKLRNLDYGDLDSLGLFQQRPSHRLREVPGPGLDVRLRRVAAVGPSAPYLEIART